MKELIVGFFFFVSVFLSNAQITYRTTLDIDIMGGILRSHSIEVAPDGNGCLAIGNKGEMNLTHLDSLNNYIWSANYNGFPNGSVQLSADSLLSFGTNFNYISSCTDKNKNYFLSYTIDSSILVTGGGLIHYPHYVAVLCIDSGGAVIWNHNFRFEVNDGATVFAKIFYDSFSNSLFLIAQNSIVKIDTSGIPFWRKYFYSNGPVNLAEGKSLNNGELIVVGKDSSDIFLTKVSTDGNVIWYKFFDSLNIDDAQNVDVFPNQNLILSSIRNNADYDLIKCDSSGNILISKNIPAAVTGNFTGRILVSNENSLLVFSGNKYFVFDSTLICHDSLHASTFFSAGWTSVSVSLTGCKKTENGLVISFKKEYNDSHMGYDFFCTYVYSSTAIGENCGGAYPFNTSFSNSNFNVVSKTLIDSMINAIYTSDVIVTRSYFNLAHTGPTSCSVEVLETSDEYNFILSPNPTTSTFTIASATQLQNAELEIYNLLGEKKCEVALSGKQSTINIENLPAGIYFVKLQSEKGSAVQKLVVQ